MNVPLNLYLTLWSNITMPPVGYGTWQATDAELERGVEAALEAGYRHIDTAHAYENEKPIGNVISRWIKSGKIQRKDLFLVTKIPPSGNYAEGVPKFLKRSLENLQVDYIDLYLIHVPFRFRDVEGQLHPQLPNGKIDFVSDVDHVAIWKAMEAQYDAGLVKSIGVSNFNISQISRILNIARVPLVSLQVELHAYFQQTEIVNFCKKNNITVTAYSPLGAPGLGKFLELFGKHLEVKDILANPVVLSIGKKHNKTAAQVVLRHAIQKGLAVIPKSTTPSRIKENINIFDFVLDDEDMQQLNGLDKGSIARNLDFSVFGGATEQPEYPF